MPSADTPESSNATFSSMEGADPVKNEAQAVMMKVQEPWDLSRYHRGDWSPGRSLLVRTLWYFNSQLLFENGWFPVNRLKITVLRCFGARIGRGVSIKPNVRIKFPWRLTVGDHCWIGEDAWIDNLDHVQLGDHVCVSQGVYLCTGSHDARQQAFTLKTAPITIGKSCWVCCRAVLLGGVVLEPRTIVFAGAVVRPSMVRSDEAPQSASTAGSTS